MRRRQFFKFAGTALIASSAAHAQKDLPLIGVLVPGNAKLADDRIAAIREGLQESGLREGANYRFALRFADAVFDRLPSLALELASLKPQLIIASAAAVSVVHRTVPNVPLVFTSYSPDPIKAGLAQSYVRPAGHATGNVMSAAGGEGTLTQKRISLFKELVPHVKRLGFIGSSSDLAMAELDALIAIADQFDFEVLHHNIEQIDDIEHAVAACSREAVGAIYVSGAALLYNNFARVLSAVTAPRIPTVGTYPDWGRAGLLMSYSSDLLDGFRHAGIYAAKILNGERRGELPIEQASKFFLVVNVRTARQLDVSVPPSLLALADEVIE